MPLKLLNWDVEWAATKWKAAELQHRIDQHTADIICLTETDTGHLDLPPDGHSIRRFRPGGSRPALPKPTSAR